MKKLIWLLAASVTIIAGCSKNNSSDPNDNTLLTLNISNDGFSFYSSIYYVITDENGAIVSEAKYVSGTKSLTMTSSKPYKKERFNFYRIAAGENNYPSEVRGWLQIKKGSSYNNDDQLLLQTPTRAIRYHLKNLVPFTKLGVIGDYSGYSIAKLTDTVPGTSPTVTDNGNLYVYLRTNGSVGFNSYNFFNVAKGANDVNIDMTQINKAPLVKSITSPGTNLQVQVRARPNKKYVGNYDLGLVTSKTNQLNFYYPQEQFAEYFSEMTYLLGGFNYYFVKNTDVIPDKVDTYSAVINYGTIKRYQF